MANRKTYRIIPLTANDVPVEVTRSIIKQRIEIALAKNGLVADNLDEVLCKYISEEMRNEQKRRS